MIARCRLTVGCAIFNFRFFLLSILIFIRRLDLAGGGKTKLFRKTRSI